MLALRDDKFMRVLLMFDIPTKSKKEQKYATRFRNELIKQGFFMMQFSVYMRICKGVSAAKSAVERVRGILPPLGNVRTLIITEKQFDNMQILLGSAGFNEKMNDDKNLVLFAFDEKIGDYRYLSEPTRDIAESSVDSAIEAQLAQIPSKPMPKSKKPVEQRLFEF
ncbi:CRISPR-associated endonuclease Cas2 [Helicobacter sp. 23-1045]